MARDYLSPREQQIMEVIYRRERATAAEVGGALPGSPSNSTVRTLLRILEQKGHLTHDEEAGRFVYRPTRPRPSAARSALEGVLRTFFHGSVEQAFASLLSTEEARLTPQEFDRLAEMIQQARDAQGD